MTAQVHEKLYLNGKLEYLQCEPSFPKDIVAKLDPWEEDGMYMSTACWRGYVGTWKIKDKRFYLRKLEGKYKLKSKQPVFAEWYTGVLSIPQGEILQYGETGLDTLYEKTIFIKIVKGMVLKTLVRDNKDLLGKDVLERFKSPAGFDNA